MARTAASRSAAHRRQAIPIHIRSSYFSHWTEKCSLIPEDAPYLKLKMGEVVDYFKPIEGKTICEMLNSKIYHLECVELQSK